METFNEIVLDKSTGNLSDALPLAQQRPKINLDWILKQRLKDEVVIGESRYEFHEVAPPEEITTYPTTAATITVAGVAATTSLSGSNIADIDDTIVVTTVLTGGELITYPNAILKLPVVRCADNLPTNDEVYFTASIIDGVLSATGSLPRSGNWQIGIVRTNRSLSRIGADWEISGDDIGFIV